VLQVSTELANLLPSSTLSIVFQPVEKDLAGLPGLRASEEEIPHFHLFPVEPDLFRQLQ